ncbi:hypothetical protein J7E62_11255 [Variovorax paradoxus]|nr:hypothetical protein [Variovorax paradoxus]
MFERIDATELSKLNRMSQVNRSTYLGIARLLRGELLIAATHLGDALRNLEMVEASDRQFIAEAAPEIPILAYTARLRVMQGLLDQADACVIRSRGVAEESGHAATRAWALQMEAFVSAFRGDTHRTASASSEMLQISRKLGIKTRAASGVFFGGLVLVAQGRAGDGAAMLADGYAQWASAGGTFHCTEYASIAAHALLRAGLRDEALRFVTLGEQVQSETEERHFSAELVRLRGCLAEHDPTVTARLFLEAIDIAERQGAKLFSLRAATDLALLYRDAGREAEAVAHLAPVYQWFTEGADFPDVGRARAFLAG